MSDSVVDDDTRITLLFPLGSKPEIIGEGALIGYIIPGTCTTLSLPKDGGWIEL